MGILGKINENLMLAKYGVISGLGRLTSHSTSSSSSSTVLRRQQFLVRALSGSNSKIHRPKLIRAMSSTSEADAESVLRTVTPSLDPKRHKGQAGENLPSSLCLNATGFFVCLLLQLCDR